MDDSKSSDGITTTDKDDLLQEWIIDGSSWQDFDAEIFEDSTESEQLSDSVEPTRSGTGRPSASKKPGTDSRQHRRAFWWLVGILVGAAASEAFGQLFSKLFALLP